MVYVHLKDWGQRTAKAQTVQAAAMEALTEADVPGEVLILHPDMHGLIVDRKGSADLFDFNAGE